VLVVASVVVVAVPVTLAMSVADRVVLAGGGSVGVGLVVMVHESQVIRGRRTA